MALPGSPAATPEQRSVSRVSALDLMQLATDAVAVGNQVGAVLVLNAQRGFDPEAVALLGERIERVPRPRQRLVRVPVGYGRPIWVDDPRFDLARHITVVAAPGGRDDAALLRGRAAERVTTPLQMSRPLWSATFVTGLAGARVALIVVFHHVLADGLAGLTALAQLLDTPNDAPSTQRFPQPPPTHRQLRADARRTRLAALRRLPSGLRVVRGAANELSMAGTGRAPRTCLNRPTGAHQRLALVHTDLAAVHRLAHNQDATVNDVVLTAVTGAARLQSDRV